MILPVNFSWKSFFKKHYLFFLIFVLALFLRIYRLEYLTTFGHDQGIDFLKVREMILNHDLTLIGIKVSVANFYQGPLYLYILLPFFYIMNFNPLAGATAAVTISLITLCLLYKTLTDLSGVKAANIGTLIFAVSFQFIQYGNTPLYEHFAPLFYIACIYFLYHALKNKNKISYVFLTGLCAGLSIELHFLSTILALASLILIICGLPNKVKSFFFFLIGLFISLSPTIIFELKHNFLNTNYFIQYLLSNQTTRETLQSKLMIFLKGSGTFFTADNIIGGLIIFILICFILTRYKKEHSQSFDFICRLDFLLLFMSLIFLLKSPTFGWWYPLPFWVTSLMLLALYFSHNLKNKILAGILIFVVAVNFFFSVSLLGNNHGYYMPPGWSLKKIDQTVEIIVNDATEDRANFNIASLIESSRAYPLRYAVQLKGKEPGKVTGYNQNNALYVISNDSASQLINSNVWEIKEFLPFKLGQSWDMGDNIYLYRLDRIRK